MAMQSCVKLSVNCYLRLTFGWHLNQHLINTQWTLSWHSINVLIDTRSTVRSQVLIDSSVLIDTQWHVCKNQSTLNQLLTKMLLVKCPLCVNQGVNQISIKCCSRVLIDTRSQILLGKKMPAGEKNKEQEKGWGEWRQCLQWVPDILPNTPNIPTTPLFFLAHPLPTTPHIFLTT